MGSCKSILNFPVKKEPFANKEASDLYVTYNISFQWGWCILFYYPMLSITWSFLSLYCIAICWFVSVGWNRIAVHQNNTNKNNKMNGIDVFFDRQKCPCCGILNWLSWVSKPWWISPASVSLKCVRCRRNFNEGDLVNSLKLI